MNVTVHPGLLRGTVTVPPSKSLSHRALIASFLAGRGTVKNLAENSDIDATRDCLDALRNGGICDCRDSGSTMRFLVPLALVLNGGGTFTGNGRLPERPMGPYFELFTQKGVSVERSENGFTLRGALQPGCYSLPGNVSSQFVTGLLFALPLLNGESTIVLTSPLESASYAALTLQVLSAFGIQIEPVPDGWCIPGGQAYRPCDYTVEGDESAAAFWRVANALGSAITYKGLNPHSIQGDCAMRAIIDGDIRVIDVRECPDLVPALAVLCCFREGESRIVHAERLRLKECDRLAVMAGELNALGASVTELPDGLIIQGLASPVEENIDEAGGEGLHGRRPLLRGGNAGSHSDHRVPMSLAIAATRCRAPVTIRGAECVEKSYPLFWKDFSALGGNLR
ncbi:MAG: 3-phosphoshikimate 1-carboxyvinyltransferase [Oscillospiraceae bacterium]|jgi:3-phosphoshikimate 1-carboxyvinyltransferase|nr:3-phosphoshikimate 1-carboxyvinyltransferase [Oscillospiraceae bacterium]